MNAKTSNGNGGVVSIGAFNGLMTISSSSFTDLQVPNDQSTKKFEGSFLYSVTSTFALSMTSNSIQCQSSYVKQTIEDHLRLKKSSFGGALYLYYSSTTFLSSGNTFRYCYGTYRGGAMTIGHTTMTETSSKFY